MNGVDIKIKELKSSGGNHIIDLLEDHKKKHQFKTYSSALDDFAYKFGLGTLNIPILNQKDKLIGYSPKIKYYPGNVFKIEPSEQELYSNNLHKSLKNSEESLTKYIIYKLMEITNPEKYLQDEI